MNDYNLLQLSDIYRNEVAPLRRWVTKVGTDVLTTGSGNGINERTIEGIVGQLHSLQEAKKEVALVTSGAIGYGDRIRGVKTDLYDTVGRQVSASVGQPRLMATYNRAFDNRHMILGEVQLTFDRLSNPEKLVHYRNAMEGMFKERIVPVINENDVVDPKELEAHSYEANGNGEKSQTTFSDNDELAAMAAYAIGAQALIILSIEEGLMDYSRNRKISVIEDIQDAHQYVRRGKSSGGLGGMESKLRAISYAMDRGIHVILASGLKRNVVPLIFGAEPLGTYFRPRPLA